MKKRTKILIVILIIIAVIQLPFFTPVKNYASEKPANDIYNHYDVPMNVMMNLNNSCYDCHSNYTKEYPWYYHIQPVSWWMNLHIKQAQKHVNFSEFANYTPEQAAHKFKEIREQMEKRDMPLHSYLWMHDEAKMTEQEYKDVAEWAQRMEKEVLMKNQE